jgi:hypothetical protein
LKACQLEKLFTDSGSLYSPSLPKVLADECSPVLNLLGTGYLRIICCKPDDNHKICVYASLRVHRINGRGSIGFIAL